MHIMTRTEMGMETKHGSEREGGSERVREDKVGDDEIEASNFTGGTSSWYSDTQ